MTNDAKRTGGARRLVGAVAFVLALGGCASYSGYSLKAGVATEPEVVSTMGAPAMRWLEPDGSVQLAYPRGPAGTQTFMAYLGQEQVLRLIGPPQPHWTQYFKARDELVWEWLFCDNWNQEAFFDVLFDGTSKLVRSTMQRQNLNGWDGVPPGCGQ